ncbi:hypothetical protein BD560DRAFT_429222 [Blakeslea trispora]|nr:hypothetical protein BD560DRAFT_429222 [Blakeslea trispora]
MPLVLMFLDTGASCSHTSGDDGAALGRVYHEQVLIAKSGLLYSNPCESRVTQNGRGTNDFKQRTRFKGIWIFIFYFIVFIEDAFEIHRCQCRLLSPTLSLLKYTEMQNKSA